MNFQRKTVLLKSGQTCVIRRAEERDAEKLIEFLKTVCGETRNLLREPEKITMTAEWERDYLRKMAGSGTELMLQAELEAVSSNKAAVGLYKKLGFEATGTLPRTFKYKDGAYADFLFMVKRLD